MANEPVMTVSRAFLRAMRHGWSIVDVPENAPSGIAELPSLDKLKLNSEKVMRMVDTLPAELREMVREHDWQIVGQMYPEEVRRAWWKAAENNWGRG